MCISKKKSADLNIFFGENFFNVLSSLKGNWMETLIKEEYHKKCNSEVDFTISLLILVAIVEQTEKRTPPMEMKSIRDFLQQHYDETRYERLMLIFRGLLEQNLQAHLACQKICAKLNRSIRLQLLNAFILVVTKDQSNLRPDSYLLTSITQMLELEAEDLKTLQLLNTKPDNYATDIFRQYPSSSKEELQESFKMLSAKFHPNHSSALGKEEQLLAKDLFMDLQEAYNQVYNQ